MGSKIFILLLRVQISIETQSGQALSKGPDLMGDHLRQIETDYENELPNDIYDNIDDAANRLAADLVDTLTEITGEVSDDDLFLTDDQRIAKQTDKICSDFLNQTWSWPNSETMDGTDFSRPSRKRFSKRQSAHLAETISHGLIETQIEIITSGFEMIMTGYHPDVHV